jgi:hypothetical protein
MSESFPTGSPSSAHEIRAALENLHASSRHYLDALSLETFRTPQGEKWSPADHVRHLTKSTVPLVRALRMPKAALLLRFGMRMRRPRNFEEVRAVYREALDGGVTAGPFAPKPQEIPSDASEWREKVMASWRNAAGDLHASIPRWSELWLDRIRLPHPAMGMLSVREMLFFTLYHNAHHLRLVESRVPTSQR